MHDREKTLNLPHLKDGAFDAQLSVPLLLEKHCPAQSSCDNVHKAQVAYKICLLRVISCSHLGEQRPTLFQKETDMQGLTLKARQSCSGWTRQASRCPIEIHIYRTRSARIKQWFDVTDQIPVKLLSWRQLQGQNREGLWVWARYENHFGNARLKSATSYQKTGFWFGGGTSTHRWCMFCCFFSHNLWIFNMLVNVNMGKHVDPVSTAILATARDSLRPKSTLEGLFRLLLYYLDMGNGAQMGMLCQR